MKYAEMNERQKKAFRNVLGAANWIIGGWENTLEDYPEESDEYKSAQNALADHDGLVAAIYQEAINNVHDYALGFAPASALKDIRFCGKEFIMERVEKRVAKMGY